MRSNWAFRGPKGPWLEHVVEIGQFPVFGFLACVLALVALIWLRKLSRQVDRLQRRLDTTRLRSDAPTSLAHSPARPSQVKPAEVHERVRRDPSTKGRGPLGRFKQALGRRDGEPTHGDGASVRPNWMVWLGGICVALAGVFLVKYSIDQGLLTPWTRVALATFTGFAMHAVAEWLPRRTGRRHPTFSALAASGSVTLCAGALAALHLYELIPPLAAFAFLAWVSIATTSLALRHGPVFAALGMIGSYAVPLLVGGESGRIVGVLLYALIVSATVLLVIRYVYRAWLWWGMLAGSAFWWVASLSGSHADGYRGFYLALLAGAILWLPSIHWRRHPNSDTDIGVAVASGWQSLPTKGAGYREAIEASIRSALLVVTVAQGISIAIEPFSTMAAASWTPLVVILFLASRYRKRCAALPWIALAVQGAAWISTSLEIEDFRVRWQTSLPAVQTGLPIFAASIASVYTALSCWNLRTSASVSLWASLAVASPVCWLGIAFAVATDRAPSWEWTCASAVLGLLYWLAGWRLYRDGRYSIASWTLLGLSGAYSLVATMAFREAGLTLALALQAVPLAWLAVRHRASNVEWMTKAVLAAVVLRLTFNPWLPAYAEGSHWIWWTYGGSTLSCFVASRIASQLPRLRRWIEAVAAHLLVLTCWAVTRDLVYSGEVFATEYGLPEAAINTAVWGALGLAYHWRSRVSQHVAPVYRWASRTVLSMSLANYGVVLLVLNPLWGAETVGETRIWNLLLLAYGAPVVLAYLASRHYEPFGARLAGMVAPLALFTFVSLEIRHLWQRTLDLALPASDGEMATYSVVWLLMAVTAILAGGMRFGPGVYRAGMALLLLTICKVFMVDMSGLTGLLRAGSFMGLGLSLLGLAYLHQRLGKVNAPPDYPDS